MTAPYLSAHETHSAIVLLIGDHAYKVKKPVDLGFLDFTTLDARRAICQREVALNRRIAPDVYLGVAQVLAPDGDVCEHMVVMRRMPADRRLSALVREGAPVDDDVHGVARRVAAFHATARRDGEVAAEGTRDAIRRRWSQSFEQVRSLSQAALPTALQDEIESLTYDFLDGREPLFADRVAAGRVVDGHGDLLADDIYCFPDGPRILDCIEFDDRLRFLDQLDDAAFLAMDLEYLGAPDLAVRFLDWYVEFAADPAPTALRHHFVAYRAYVRAKVSCLRHAQGDRAAADQARRYAELTAAHLRAGAVTLTLVGGLPATGKSTLSAALADHRGATVISTDRVRKEMAGLAPQDCAAAPYGEGIYTPQWTDRTYAEVLRRAEMLLERGEQVVLDCSWSRERHRACARDLARRTRSRLTEIRCEAPAEVVLERLRVRQHTFSDASDASDADAPVAARMATEMDPWPQARAVGTTDGPVPVAVLSP
jgi:aminoglycoside phosphotransferase family enzyme/predicted kinase